MAPSTRLLGRRGGDTVNIGRPLLVLAAILALELVSATPGFAKEKTKIELVNDCGGFGPGGACDNTGVAAGFVTFEQDATGALTIDVTLRGARPETTYLIALNCGPTIALACGYVFVGAVTTNTAGNGRSGDVVVSVATLQAAPFGSGQRSDEITMVVHDGDLSAGGFDQITPFAYTVP